MKCPHCTTPDLVMSERQGIEIDYCPTCRGVWLDRGELDKIIERAAEQVAPAPAAAPPPAPPQQQYGAPAQAYPPQGYQKHYDPHYYKHKKHKSWLSELFD